MTLRLIKTRPSGLNTYEVIDDNGNRIVKYHQTGLISDWGIRLIWSNEPIIKA